MVPNDLVSKNFHKLQSVCPLSRECLFSLPQMKESWTFTSVFRSLRFSVLNDNFILTPKKKNMLKQHKNIFKNFYLRKKKGIFKILFSYLYVHCSCFYLCHQQSQHALKEKLMKTKKVGINMIILKKHYLCIIKPLCAVSKII